MINVQEIQATLARMAELLHLGGIYNWADALEKLKNEIIQDPAAASAKILSMYGGMGSLNDLIIYRNGQPLTRENNELDALRSKLHALCRG